MAAGAGQRAASRGEGTTDWQAVEWWLDAAALPDHYWVRLTPGQDGILVQAHTGEVIVFQTLAEAIEWLREEDCALLRDLQEDGDVPWDLHPPANFPHKPPPTEDET